MSSPPSVLQRLLICFRDFLSLRMINDSFLCGRVNGFPVKFGFRGERSKTGRTKKKRWRSFQALSCGLDLPSVLTFFFFSFSLCRMNWRHRQTSHEFMRKDEQKPFPFDRSGKMTQPYSRTTPSSSSSLFSFFSQTMTSSLQNPFR